MPDQRYKVRHNKEYMDQPTNDDGDDGDGNPVTALKLLHLLLQCVRCAGPKLCEASPDEEEGR